MSEENCEHEFVESYNDGRTQVLTCTKCGYKSSARYQSEHSK